MTRAIELSEGQALWFRARRGHLAGPGAKNSSAAARAILGAQSQQLLPSLLALSARTKGRPTAEALKRQLFEPPRSLVRTWGQRDTLFVYDAATHWRQVVAAHSLRTGGSRRGGMPPAPLVAKAEQMLRKAEEPLMRSELLPLVPRALVKEWEAKMKVGEPAAKRFAAGRLFWMLANQGHACVGTKKGAEQSYAAREDWFPDLPWPKEVVPLDAAAQLAEDYLAAFAPASPADLGHFFGANVSMVESWLERLHTRDVVCGARKRLVALENDARVLRAKVPTGAREWPVRLLPLWDSAMMAHEDKSWLTPELEDEKRVWRKAGVVAATVLCRGRVVACWSQAVKRGRLEVTVEPLTAWRGSKHLAGVKREAKAVAAHVGVGDVAVTVAS